MTSVEYENRQRWLSGQPAVPQQRPWYRRMLRSPLFWLTVVLVPLYVFFLLDEYFMLSPDQTFPDGTVALGLNDESLATAAYWAMWTALAYSLLFMWLDRFRPQRPLIWFLTFMWGAAAATWFSIYINSWAGEAMATTDANADMGTRPAIFIAPFVEEATKATVLFLLVILWRARIVSRLSMVVLAGLSAVGFAFVENIIYYARAIVYAVNTIEIEDPMGEVMELVLLRGLYTSYGHPLFTMMTATGLAIGLGARSRIVRIMAPLGGFLVAAGGHMLFNGMASVSSLDELIVPWIMTLTLVALLVISLLLGVVGQTQLLRRRLHDFHQVGWLQERDVTVYSSAWKRIKLHLAGLFRGPRVWWATAKFMRLITELAYLREQMTRGLVAEGGNHRAREIVVALEALRPTALTETAGLRIVPPRRKKPTDNDMPAPVAPGPAGLGGNWPEKP